jgi:RNA polymerase sigma factor, sigma-70 family
MERSELGQLAEHAQQGDADAFAEIYTALSPGIYHYALRMLRHEQDAMDAMQDAMADLFQNLSHLKNAHALVAYTYQIAYNRCLQMLRLRKRYGLSGMTEALAQRVEERIDFLPAEYWEQEELYDALLRAVNKLPEEQRAVIVLFYCQQMPTKKIAELMGVKNPTVRMRLSRGRQTLKKWLADKPEVGAL